MGITRLRWSNLLHIAELDFEPERPSMLTVKDELTLVLSWLTGATLHDRKLLRCDNYGALLVAKPWSLFAVVETDELYPEATVSDSWTATEENKGVLIATSKELVKAVFVRVSGGASETIYIPPNTLYWFANSVYSVTMYTVPAATGTASYAGVMSFK